jgi:protein-disulfide isomerase
LAKSLGAKEAAFTQCLSSEKYASAVTATTEEGRTLFGVNGTPGNVIVDNQKGTFTLIAGAYPIEEFQKTIDALLK